MAWSTKGNIKGPKGDTGDAGPKGDTGAAGAGIAIAGSVATYGDLPTGLGPGDAGKGYLVQADGDLYIWSGTAFPADGEGTEFKGDKGDTGATGATGAAGATGGVGATGAAGANGAKWFTGSGAPVSVVGAVAGDMYLDTDDGTVYQLS